MIDKITVFLLFSCALCAGQMPTFSSSSSSPSATDSAEGDTSSQGTGLDQLMPGARPTDMMPSSQGIPNPAWLDTVLMNRLLKSGTDVTTQQVEREQPRTIRPIIEKTEFQRFVEETVNHPVAVYGRDLFDEAPSTFAPIDNIPVPSDYAIGPGDELLIKMWGRVDLDLTLSVDRNGQIQLPKVGSLTVAGLRYDELHSYLRSAIGRIYKGFDLNVTLGKLRSIQVFVLGEARQPGSYTLSSLSTLVDGLIASGGPSASGSMRRIELRRDSKVVVSFDVYDLGQKGDKSHDRQLLPGDVIYIPPVGPQVAIEGSVNRPGIYELKDAATVASAVEGAGGLSGLAMLDRAMLERVAERRRRTVESFELNEAGRQRELRDGDLLRISALSPKFEGAVTLRGNVAGPGRYAWREGMRITDLIPTHEFLITREHWQQHNHLSDQQNLNGPALHGNARTTAAIEATTLAAAQIDKNPSAEGSKLPIPGQKMQASQSYVNPTIDVLGDLSLTNAEVNWDYATIERLDQDLSTRLIAFNLGSAIDNPTSADNQVLKSGDVVTIFSKRDILLPLHKRTTFVRVGGEVNAPGVYRMNPGETLRDVVQRAGGLTPNSYLFAAELKRISTRDVQAKQLKSSVERMRAELSFEASNSSASMPAIAAAQSNVPTAESQIQMRAQEHLLDLLATAEPSGRIVLGIKPGAISVEDLPNLAVEDGDDLMIPALIASVQVTGEVYNPSSLRFQDEKRLINYLHDSGGPNRTADVSRIFVIRADGTVVARQNRHTLGGGNFEKMVLMPGDAIVVPPKLKKRNPIWDYVPAITQTLSQAALLGAVAATR
jgi:protein involved in polysaccharide export with SLBB domain